MSASELPIGTELIFAENREVEDIFKSDKSLIADHVWTTCRPTPKFSSSAPTVTARRIQMVRVQLQNNSRSVDTWEVEMPKVNEDEYGEDDSDESSSPGQFSSGSGRNRASEKPAPYSAEIETHAQYRPDIGKNKTSQESSPCSADAPSPAQYSFYGKKKMAEGLLAWPDNSIPLQYTAEVERKRISQISAARSSDMLFRQHSQMMPQENCPPSQSVNVYAAQFHVDGATKLMSKSSYFRSTYAQQMPFANAAGSFKYRDKSPPWAAAASPISAMQYGADVNKHTEIVHKLPSFPTDTQNPRNFSGGRRYEDRSESTSANAPPSLQCNDCGSRNRTDESSFLEQDERMPSSVCITGAKSQHSMDASKIFNAPLLSRVFVASGSNGFNEYKQECYGADQGLPDEDRGSYECDLTANCDQQSRDDAEYEEHENYEQETQANPAHCGVVEFVTQRCECEGKCI